ncbi:MAG TPA: hypothetical protein VK858_07005, partial [Longimicrobiales bacterium]|nr:hypothetical protein [Longimicrobiales bacterium]
AFVTGTLTASPGVVAVCTISPPAVNCTATTMQPGDQFVLTLTVKGTAPGLITNTATAASATNDPVPANNSATVETLLVGEGCGPGFWKNWPSEWGPTGYAPGQTVGSVFANSGRGSLTLLGALELMGGNGPQGAKDILLRAAVAAVLNAAHPGVEYPLDVADVVDQVNAALLSGRRGTILDLAELLDGYNDFGCPLP